MDKVLQDKFRQDLFEQYQKKAFECFANYQFVGEKYAAAEKQIEDTEGRIVDAEKFIADVQAKPDFHTVENKNAVKAKRDEIRKMEEAIKNVTPLAKKLFEEAADYMKEFKIRTPEEIEANKKKPAAETAVPAEKPIDPTVHVPVEAASA